MIWLPIERAPFETDKASGCKCLPECLLLVNGVMVQGKMELGMWLRRCHQRSDLWEDLIPEPTHWMPKPPEVGSPLAELGDSAEQGGTRKVGAGDLIEAHFTATRAGHLGGTSNWAYTVLRHLKEVGGAAAPCSDKPVAWVAPDGKGGVKFGAGWVFSPVQTSVATMPVYSQGGSQ